MRGGPGLVDPESDAPDLLEFICRILCTTNVRTRSIQYVCDTSQVYLWYHFQILWFDVKLLVLVIPTLITSIRLKQRRDLFET